MDMDYHTIHETCFLLCGSYLLPCKVGLIQDNLWRENMEIWPYAHMVIYGDMAIWQEGR